VRERLDQKDSREGYSQNYFSAAFMTKTERHAVGEHLSNIPIER
jgi:hypothetical protein